jgi:tRNA-dihydrouridine synthase 2
MGAALLKTPDKLVAILEALVREVGSVWQIGISVKIRILQEPQDTEKLVTRLCATGITGLTVHCRTTPMRPRQAAIRDQLRMIASVCRNAGIACVMNGDVKSRDDALALIQEYGVDGAMIATAAESNSSCFRLKSQGGLVHWRELVHEYLDAALQCENRWGNTKYLINIMVPGKDQVYNKAKMSKTYQECCRILGFDDLIPSAIRVDEILGRTGMEVPPAATAPTATAVQRAKTQNESAKAAGRNTPSTAKMPKSRQSPHLSGTNSSTSSISSKSTTAGDYSSSAASSPPPTTPADHHSIPVDITATKPEPATNSAVI